MPPEAVVENMDRIALAQQSRVAIQQGSRSFAIASMLFSGEMKADAHMLYAWCRHCDDVIDGQNLGFFDGDPAARQDSPEAMQARLAGLRELTNRALDGEAIDDPAFASFQAVALRHDLPRKYPLDLLIGFEMDATDHQYHDMSDTLAYCYHVAGVVGVMMAIIMGVDPDDHETLHRASDLGIAFQLTNICRDIADDARIGRIYLPHTWLREAGIEPTPAAILDPGNAAALSRVARRLLDDADRYYASAGFGLRRLPLRAASAVAAARAVYRDIGRLVRERGEKAWEKRAATRKRRKLWCAARGVTEAAGARINRGRAFPARGELWTPPV